MKKFQEWISDTQVNFIIKNWTNPNPQVKTQVKMAIDAWSQAANNTPNGINDPNYLESMLSLEEILPQLLKDPILKKSAESLQYVIQADKQEMESQARNQ